MTKTGNSLSIGQLANLFTQLKRLESAGMPALQAFELLARSDVKLKKPLAIALQQLSVGSAISEAGFKAGIFDNTLRSLIHAAESSGRLAEVYDQLAKHYTRLNRCMKRVKSRLYLPGLVLIISLFVQLLPDLIVSEISGLAYLWLSLGRLLVTGAAVYCLMRLPAILRSLGIERLWHGLLLHIPGVGQWVIKRQINEFFFILAMMLDAGLAFAEALPKAAASIGNCELREKFTPVLATLSNGASVAETLAKVPIIDTCALGVVKSSEQSGKLAGGILHFTELEAETIGLQDEALAEWLPRMVYGIIVIWMAYSILGSQFMTAMPDNL